MSPKRTDLLRLGRRGRYVRLVRMKHRGAWVLAVLWRGTDRKRHQQLYGLEQRLEAEQFAEGVNEELSRPAVKAEPKRLTVGELWDLYAADVFKGLRPKSKVLYKYYWGRFAAFAGPHTLAEDLTVQTMIELREALEEDGAEVNTIRKVVSHARMVFAWAETHELIPKNRVGKYVYRVAKEDRPESPAEFRMPEFLALLAQFDPRKRSQWRPFVALSLCGFQGARQHAVLHLRWEDIDLEAGTITWKAEWDKVGRTWSQPLRQPAREALAYADKFRDPSGWVFWGYTRTGEPTTYTIQSLWSALRAGENRGGMVHQTRRAGHGLRRLLAGEVAQLTGDSKLAMDAIGDRDIRQADRYLKVRNDRLADAFKRLDTEGANQMQTAPKGAERVEGKS
jgi:integrase